MNWKQSIAGGYPREPLVRAGLMLLGALLLLGQMAMASRQNKAPGRELQSAHQTESGHTPGVNPRQGGSDDCLVEAVIQVESGGKARKVGRAGERGLMQIKADTWREVTKRLYGRPIPFDRAFEPELNRIVGRAYLQELREFLLRKNAQWQTDERSLLLACYNAGPTRVQESGFKPTRWPAATRDYVQRVVALHEFYVAEGLPATRVVMARARTPLPSRS
ncbi:MAG: lytic transglycosylase domain-containing protein [Verrucomicrobia bacterium]|nr:lytic transglycosylase domain-containing protein [Verrucomicrobiota bacterium]MBU1908959.1 lytic transglycosylase domain-containing protein [Verrucomicrobiota bacterium]